MTTDVTAVAIAAVAMATETRVGISDSEVLDQIIEGLDDEAVPLFVALLRTYQHQADEHGAEALRRCGLQLARRSAGLAP